MYDISFKNVKKNRTLYILFLIVGVLFAALMVGIYAHGVNKLKNLDSNIMSYDVKVTQKEDGDGEIMYSPTYYYKVNGETYACPSTSSSSSYPGDENRIVYYDSKNPMKCMSEYTAKSNKLLLLVIIIPGVFMVVGVIGFSKANKRVKTINELNQRGKLIKGLPYSMEDTNIYVNDHRLQRLVVEYTLPTGSTVLLKGDPIMNYKSSDSDGLADLLIDEQNPDNYYIDFEINRIGGNASSDYNQSTINNNPNQINTTVFKDEQNNQNINNNY